MLYKILLIDDDWDDRKFFCDALAKVSTEVSCTAFDNGNVMIPGLMSGEIQKPDLIFLDVNMPEISGWECLALLKAHDDYKEIPVILYSTSKHREEIIRAKEAGAICFFNKPHDFGLLKAALYDVVEHLKAQNLDQLCENSPHLL